MHSSGWRSYIRYDEDQDQPDVSRALLHRVSEYASPYWKGVVIVLVSMLVISLLSLIPPLLIRELIDRAIPDKDHARLNYLALGMILVPLANGLLGVIQRYTSARIGEGIIFDLRRSVYAHLQRMSLRFYTNTQVGEMMSRLNNDVIGAQRAVTGTLVTIVSNIFSLVATLILMFSLEWASDTAGYCDIAVVCFPGSQGRQGIAGHRARINGFKCTHECLDE
jgi:ATP-binding cassette subfamily B protein